MEMSEVSSESGESEVLEEIAVVSEEKDERAIKRRKTVEGYESTFKEPTRDEMELFKETETLFKSSLFSLQVHAIMQWPILIFKLSELLKEAVPDASKTSSIERILKSLKKVLVSIPSQEVNPTQVQTSFPGKS